MYFESSYMHICTVEGCAYFFVSVCISLLNTCTYSDFARWCLLRRIGRPQAQGNQSKGVLDGQASMRSLPWTGLVPPCPGGVRASRVTRQPTKWGGIWLQGQQPQQCQHQIHHRLLPIKASNQTTRSTIREEDRNGLKTVPR